MAWPAGPRSRGTQRETLFLVTWHYRHANQVTVPSTSCSHATLPIRSSVWCCSVHGCMFNVVINRRFSHKTVKLDQLREVSVTLCCLWCLATLQTTYRYASMCFFWLKSLYWCPSTALLNHEVLNILTARNSGTTMALESWLDHLFLPCATISSPKVGLQYTLSAWEL